jgi:hypothetical protein
MTTMSVIKQTGVGEEGSERLILDKKDEEEKDPLDDN